MDSNDFNTLPVGTKVVFYEKYGYWGSGSHVFGIVVKGQGKKVRFQRVSSTHTKISSDPTTTYSHTTPVWDELGRVYTVLTGRGKHNKGMQYLKYDKCDHRDGLNPLISKMQFVPVYKCVYDENKVYENCYYSP
jgi:hypothetical protein